MNTIINKYGAFYGKTINDIEKAMCDFETEIDRVCESLDPVDARLLGSYIDGWISSKFATIVLSKAVKMRKNEKASR